MNIHKQYSGFRQTLICAAVLAACAPVHAQDGEVADSEIAGLIRPESSIDVGVWGVDGSQRDRAWFGEYNGMRDKSAYGQLEVDIHKRDDATGTSIMLRGRNLGLDNRDLSFSHEKQGDWKYSVDYSELVRQEPRSVNTGMLGLGTTTPTVVRLGTPGSGVERNFQLKRVGLGLAGEMWINPNLQLEVSFRNEDKNGARRFGIGYDCIASVCAAAPGATQRFALLMVAEPVDSTTRQIEAKLNYSDKKFNVSAGYYGSFFSNANGSFKATVPNSLNNPLGAASTLFPAVGPGVIPGGGTSLQNVLQLPVALPPDNQAHQLYVSGSYRLAPSTNATFKVAYTRATQDDNFADNGLTNAPAGVTSLDGVVNTTLVQLGLTSRPMPKLSVLANLRYEDKNDESPHVLYNVKAGSVVPPTVPASFVNRFWNNYHVSSTKVVAKLEASYQLPADLRATAGLDFSSHKRPVPVTIEEEELGGLGAVREKNRETGYRLELRRTMSETVTGAVSYGKSKRTGGEWTSLNTSALFAAAGLGYGATGTANQFLALNPTNAFPLAMTDIDREKFKLSANWTPSEKIEVQFSAENSKDENANPFNAAAQQRGWVESDLKTYSVDASFAVSDNWKLNAYASQGHQNLKVNHSLYKADIKSRSDGFGFGVSGKPTGRMEIGAQLSYLHDNTRYGLSALPINTAVVPNFVAGSPTAANLAQVAIGLPDVRYQVASLNLFGTYTLDKKSAIRINLVHQRVKLDEWTWSANGRSFVYSDNTTVNLQQNQTVNVLGIAYIYKF